MNSGQWLVVILITAAIIAMVGLGFKASNTFMQGILNNPEKLAPVLFLTIGIICILTWLFIVFTLDIYISLREMDQEIKNNQEQMHNDVMKKYTENL